MRGAKKKINSVSFERKKMQTLKEEEKTGRRLEKNCGRDNRSATKSNSKVRWFHRWAVRRGINPSHYPIFFCSFFLVRTTLNNKQKQKNANRRVSYKKLRERRDWLCFCFILQQSSLPNLFRNEKGVIFYPTKTVNRKPLDTSLLLKWGKGNLKSVWNTWKTWTTTMDRFSFLLYLFFNGVLF